MKRLGVVIVSLCAIFVVSCTTNCTAKSFLKKVVADAKAEAKETLDETKKEVIKSASEATEKAIDNAQKEVNKTVDKAVSGVVEEVKKRDIELNYQKDKGVTVKLKKAEVKKEEVITKAEPKSVGVKTSPTSKAGVFYGNHKTSVWSTIVVMLLGFAILIIRKIYKI